MKKTEYETRVTALTVAPKGEPTFSERATVISINDEAAGEFVEISQPALDGLKKIALDCDEWPAIRDAVDRLIAECRDMK